MPSNNKNMNGHTLNKHLCAHIYIYIYICMYRKNIYTIKYSLIQYSIIDYVTSHKICVLFFRLLLSTRMSCLKRPCRPGLGSSGFGHDSGFKGLEFRDLGFKHPEVLQPSILPGYTANLQATRHPFKILFFPSLP